MMLKFLDGTPVPDDYLKEVDRLIQEAADGDPGEAGEAEVLENFNRSRWETR